MARAPAPPHVPAPQLHAASERPGGSAVMFDRDKKGIRNKSGYLMDFCASTGF